MLESGESIQEIKKVKKGYVIQTNAHKLFVKVVYLKSEILECIFKYNLRECFQIQDPPSFRDYFEPQKSTEPYFANTFLIKSNFKM